MVGDVMLGRYVETLMNRYGDEYPFTEVFNLIRPVDLVVANLEGPIVERHQQTPDYVMRFNFDEKVAAILAQK